MRMEDLDRPREVPGSAARILAELEWMGLDWDEGIRAGGDCGPYNQSQRDEIYHAVLTQLREMGLIFRCTCSRKDIRIAASAPHGKTPVYPGTCRSGTSRPSDRPAAWRYRVGPGIVTFTDNVSGPFRQNVEREVGDFVIRRTDGIFAYQLAVVVDDALMGITDVVRGKDLLHSVPRQILLYQAVGAPIPAYWHVPLLLNEAGRRLAKRCGSHTVEEFRNAGGSPQELVGLLAASVGLTDAGDELLPEDLLRLHDPVSFRRCLQEASRLEQAVQNTVGRA